MNKALEKKGYCKNYRTHLGTIKTSEGNEQAVDQSFLIAASVLFNAVYIPGGKNTGFLSSYAEAIEFINEAFKHCKVIDADEFEILGKPLSMINKRKMQIKELLAIVFLFCTIRLH